MKNVKDKIFENVFSNIKNKRSKLTTNSSYGKVFELELVMDIADILPARFSSIRIVCNNKINYETN
jgi:hypothetical protein